MAKWMDLRKEFAKTDLLGQILIKKGLITNKELQEALIIQKKDKSLLGDTLIQLGRLTEETLNIALASQTDSCYLPVDKYKIPKEVINLVPRAFAIKHNFMPLDKVDNILTIVSANPFDKETIDEIEKETKHKIACIIGTKNHIIKMIETHYKK